jgi:NAD(P)-dependent dehydrogenase (short-subunit alcohol dehydrogenase family)
LATCRSEADCERLRGEGLESFRLDYTDPDSIRTALDEALARTGGTLDAVFNNGAYACPGLVEDLPVEALQAIFQTNLFGWHDLTRRVLPVMRRQGGGRIVMNSSVLGFVGAPFRGAYVATKFALEGLSDVLRIELRGSGIHVVLIEPGPVTSRIRLNAIPHFERWIDWKASAQSARYAALLHRLYEGGHDRFELPASAVTARLVTALDSPRPRARYMVTTPTYVAAAMRRLLPTGLSDRILSR